MYCTAFSLHLFLVFNLDHGNLSFPSAFWTLKIWPAGRINCVGMDFCNENATVWVTTHITAWRSRYWWQTTFFWGIIILAAFSWYSKSMGGLLSSSILIPCSDSALCWERQRNWSVSRAGTAWLVPPNPFAPWSKIAHCGSGLLMRTTWIKGRNVGSQTGLIRIGHLSLCALDLHRHYCLRKNV